jgi:hypothetical protein
VQRTWMMPKNVLVLGLLAVVACGGSSTGGTGGGGGTGAGGSAGSGGGGSSACDDAVARVAEVAQALGCEDDSAFFGMECEGLRVDYPSCLDELDAYLGCSVALPDAGWECSSDGDPAVKDTECMPELTAFESCAGG